MSELWRIVKLKVLPEYRLEVEFADGVQGIVDLSQELWGPMFEPLRAPDRFAEVTLDEFGAPCWPNGADIAPDAIYEDLTRGSSATP
jgi:hypothetical protein